MYNNTENLHTNTLVKCWQVEKINACFVNTVCSVCTMWQKLLLLKW